jgi:hypothetical protein
MFEANTAQWPVYGFRCLFVRYKRLDRRMIPMKFVVLKDNLKSHAN